MPEAPQFGVLLPQGQAFGIAFLKFGHRAGPQGIGTDFIYHGLFLHVTSESGDNPTRLLPLPGAILAQRSPEGKVNSLPHRQFFAFRYPACSASASVANVATDAGFIPA